MKRNFRTLAIVLVAANMSLCAYAQTTTDQDALVRRTYARLTMTSEIGTLVREVIAQPRRQQIVESKLAQGTVYFKVATLRGGNINEIADMPYKDIVSIPLGDVVSFSNMDYSTMTAEGKVVAQEGVRAQWQPEGKNVVGAEWTYPLAKALPLMGLAGYTRYASAHIIVTLEGRSRSYNSLFLFKPSGEVAALDNIVGLSGALQRLVTHSVYPHALLEGRDRVNVQVQSWLNSHQVLNASCSSNKQTECCDLSTMRCGVTPEDSKTSMATIGSTGK